MAKYNIHSTARIGSLGEKQINAIAGELTEMTLENDLRRQLQDNIKRLRDMGTYRGRRHAMSLPVRGQRTRTQVSSAVFETGTWESEMADKDMADHDREEVQPRGETRLEGSVTPVIFFPCYFFRTMHIASGRRKDRIHHCKDTKCTTDAFPNQARFQRPQPGRPAGAFTQEGTRHVQPI